jgi:hypothetical protein
MQEQDSFNDVIVHFAHQHGLAVHRPLRSRSLSKWVLDQQEHQIIHRVAVWRVLSHGQYRLTLCSSSVLAKGRSFRACREALFHESADLRGEALSRLLIAAWEATVLFDAAKDYSITVRLLPDGSMIPLEP